MGFLDLTGLARFKSKLENLFVKGPALAIVATGNTHAAIASGQHVYVTGHPSLADGLYTATAAINANGTLSTSNLTATPSGAANALQSQIDTLNRKISTNCTTLASFVSRFANSSETYIVQVSDDAASALSGNLAGAMTVTGYKTYDNAYIVYYATDSQPRFYSGYIKLSNNAVTFNQMYAIKRVKAKFTGVTVSAGSYKKLCSYSQILPSGFGCDNIISVRNYGGTFTGAQAFQMFSDGIYVYSSHAYSNKEIDLYVLYSPYATIQSDADKTIAVS